MGQPLVSVDAVIGQPFIIEGGIVQIDKMKFARAALRGNLACEISFIGSKFRDDTIVRQVVEHMNSRSAELTLVNEIWPQCRRRLRLFKRPGDAIGHADELGSASTHLQFVLGPF
jgi:hypothetical protein